MKKRNIILNEQLNEKKNQKKLLTRRNGTRKTFKIYQRH